MFIEFEGAFLNIKQVISAVILTDHGKKKVFEKNIFGIWPIYKTVEVKKFLLKFEFVENSPNKYIRTFTYYNEDRIPLEKKLKEIIKAVKDSGDNHINQVFEEAILRD
jgi:hypothetical protein